MKLFQLVSLIIFGVFILIAVIIFATYQGASTVDSHKITVWGFISDNQFNIFLNNTGLDDDLFEITYVQKREENFDREFVEALASGIGPDVVLIYDDFLFKHKDRLYPISFNDYSERDFKDNFIEAGEIFLDFNTILGLPIIIDPIVMYWNRNIFTENGITQPLRFWDEFTSFSERVTRKDETGRITRSAVSLGEFFNINNAKNILSSMFIQAGNPISERVSGGGYISVLNSSINRPVPPAHSVLQFYTQFADPTKSFNSWNRSLPSSINMFTSNDLAIYFGFASEIFQIRSMNPNLNFDVAHFPQIRDFSLNLNYARVKGFSIVRNSRRIPASLEFIRFVTNRNSSLAMSSVLNLPSSRRDVLQDRPPEAFMSIFYDSAIRARSWIDPERTESREIFREMVESVTGGRATVSGAADRASNRLNLILREI